MSNPGLHPGPEKKKNIWTISVIEYGLKSR